MEENNKKAMGLYQKLTRKSKKYRPLFILCTALEGLAYFLIFSSVGVLLEQILQAVTGSGNVGSLRNMIIYLALVIVFSICAGFSATGFTWMEERIQKGLRLEMLESYLHASEQAAAKFSSTEVLNRMNYDLKASVNLVGKFMSGWIFQPMLAGILSILWLLTVNWSVAVLCIGCSAVNMLIMHLAADKLQRMNGEMTKGKSGVVRFQGECVEGATEIRTFHLREKFLERLKGQLDVTSGAMVRYHRLEGLRWAGMSFFADCLSVVALLVLGAVLASQGYIAFSSIMLGLPLLGQIGEGIIAITNYSVLIKEYSPNVERVFEVIELPPEEGSEAGKTAEAAEDDGSAEEAEAAGDLAVENVTFSYGDQPILQDLSFHVKAGEKVAFVGESGGGKSTLLRLLLGLYLPEKGSIALGTESLGKEPISHWRKHFAYLPQESYLFCDSIEENIRLGRERSNAEKSIEEAAKEAFADGFISEKAEGYQTMVGEDNKGFSGGQLQRICLARALYRDAQVLLLDEPTSALDAQSEEMIKEAISRIRDNRMVVMVTHRLHITENFDRIYVMDNGKILEWGTHSQLLERGGKYRSLWEKGRR